MNIVAQLNVFNSEEYLWYVLKSIYLYVDRIVVIDGAYRESMPSKYSTDRTKIIVNGFDDPEKKIIYIKCHSLTQNEQRDRIFEYTSGMDWLFLIDDDELYKIRDLIYLRKFLKKTKDNAFKIRAFNFVNSFDWFYPTSNMRIWKIVSGMKFKGSNTVIPYEDQSEIETIPKIDRYHYSYVRKIKRLAIKIKQTREFQRGKKFPWERDGEFVKRKEWNKKKFKGSHPKILKDHPYRNKEWRSEWNIIM